MTRSLRIACSGAWYHVMNRGAARRDVFLEPNDIRAFMSLLAELEDRFRAEVHAYCLMNNHYHALLRTREANLSDVMRHLDGVYTQRFHRRHGTDGALFRGRYCSVLVQADKHLLHVSRYIHLNPVEANLVMRPEDWPHSSLRGYLDPLRSPRWLRTSAVLAYFGSIGSRQLYHGFITMGLDPGTRTFYGRPRIPPVLGSDAFREQVRQEVTPVDPEVAREFPDLRELGRTPLGAIARELEEAFELQPGMLRLRSRKRLHALARGAFVHAARRLGGWRLREVAAWLGYRSYACAARAAIRFHAKAAEEPRLIERLHAIVARLEEGEALLRARERASPSTRSVTHSADSSYVKT